MGVMLFQAHSGLRYLVLLAGVIALLLVLAHRFGSAPEKARRGALSAFAGLTDLQVLLGLILVFVRPFFGALMGHIIMMLLAVTAVHVLTKRARTATDPGRGFTLALLAVVLPLVFMIGGILAIGRAIL